MWFFKQGMGQSVAPQREEAKVAPVARHVAPVEDWFTDVVRPMERVESVEGGSSEDFMALMDKKGWWEDETVI
jgi:hypothetical protein